MFSPALVDKGVTFATSAVSGHFSYGPGAIFLLYLILVDTLNLASM